MSVTFDPASRRIVLNPGVTSVTAQLLYSRWKEWAQANAQWPAAFRVVGGDPIGGGLFVASYFFLTNGWRVRPQEANHTLVIDGNLVVDGGGVPVVNTLGAFNVSVQYTVPVQAQGISTSGGGGATAAQVWQQPIEGSLSAEQMLRIVVAALSGRTAGIGTSTEQYLSADGATPRIAATFDANGNRTSVVLDGG